MKIPTAQDLDQLDQLEAFSVHFRRFTGAFGLTVLLGTELLSNIGALHLFGILALWAAFGIFLVLYARRFRCSIQIPRSSLSLLLPAAALAVGVLLCGFLSAPNNWDSMTYHLPRVAQWASRQSIGIFPTNSLFQVTNPAWTEYVFLHLQLLSQSDRLFFLVSFGAWIGCAFQVWALAARQGQGSTALLLALSVPIGILQASSTKNDIVAAFWALQLFSALQSLRFPLRMKDWLWVGIPLGLLLATKGTGYLYAIAILTVFLGSNLQRKIWLGTAVAGLLGLSINFSYFLRNFLVFGSPLPNGGGERLFVERLHPTGILGNLANNLALHLNAPWAWWNSGLNALLNTFHQGIGRSPGDPLFTLQHSGFSLPPLFFYEDYDGCTLLFLLALLTLPLLRDRAFRKSSGHLFALFALGFLLFSLLKWSPWNARYHLPFFLLLIPGLSQALHQRIGTPAASLVAIGLCLASLPYAYANRLKPLFPLDGRTPIYLLEREAQYFSAAPHLYAHFRALTEKLKASDCRWIGLSSSVDSFEYPLWVLLGFPSKPLNILQENVENATARLEDKAAQERICAHVDLREFR